MRIIVCVKQVIDTAARIEIKDGKVDGAGLSRVLNPYDEFSIEEALKIRESKPGTKITLVSLGPESFSDVLRAGLAMGADQAVHLLDPAFDGLDSLAVSCLLGKAVESIGFDLIFCGRQAVDVDMAQLGPALAVYLKIPCVTVVTGLEFAENWSVAIATRQIEGGSEIIESPVPVLLTCQKGLNQPRLPSFKGIMAAKKKQIEIFDADKLGFVTPVTTNEASTAISNGLELPLSRNSVEILDGSINDSVAKLVKALREKEKVV
jgi:electron transfer flavoprotein beta subunit